MNREQLTAEADRLIAEYDAARQKTKVFATKLNMEQADKFERICAIEGATPYEVIQTLVDAYIRFKDPGTVVSPELNKLRIAFDLEVRIKDRLRLSDPSTDVEVREATYFLGSPEHKGMRLVHVYMPFFGEAESTQNIKEVLDRTLQEMPVLYTKLVQECKRRHIDTVYELLCTIAEETDGIEDINEIESTFSDNDLTESGKRMASAPYRRTMVNSMDAFERRQLRLEFEADADEETINNTF